MQYNFFIQNDKLMCHETVIPRTGNVNTYLCTFNINTKIKGLQWFCVFKQNDTAIAVPIVKTSCFIPFEVLENEGELKIGCYATNGNADDFKRKTTNWLTFRTTTGAYTEATEPETPTPDLWETLILKTVPRIGANNNWFVYDIKQGGYVDTGVKAIGQGGSAGLTPEQEANIKEIPNKANKATTLSGYGITDAYTKTEVDKQFEDMEGVINEQNESKLTLVSGTEKDIDTYYGIQDEDGIWHPQMYKITSEDTFGMTDYYHLYAVPTNSEAIMMPPPPPYTYQYKICAGGIYMRKGNNSLGWSEWDKYAADSDVDAKTTQIIKLTATSMDENNNITIKELEDAESISSFVNNLYNLLCSDIHVVVKLDMTYIGSITDTVYLTVDSSNEYMKGELILSSRFLDVASFSSDFTDPYNFHVYDYISLVFTPNMYTYDELKHVCSEWYVYCNYVVSPFLTKNYRVTNIGGEYNDHYSLPSTKAVSDYVQSESVNTLAEAKAYTEERITGYIDRRFNATDEVLLTKANSEDVYTKTEIDNLILGSWEAMV